MNSSAWLIKTPDFWGSFPVLIWIKYSLMIFFDFSNLSKILTIFMRSSECMTSQCSWIDSAFLLCILPIKLSFKSDWFDFKLPFEAINKKSGWCDDKNSHLYNQYIEFPFKESAEQLYRTDDLYDIVCVINYNTDPIVAGKGSAIFLHVCRYGFPGTEGCIAMEKRQLLDIAKNISMSSTIEIKN